MRTLRIIALVALLPTAALADREITPLVGYRQGTVEMSTGIACLAVVGTQCPIAAKSEESATLGVLANLPFREKLDWELLLNRQPTELRFHDGQAEVPRLPGGRAGLDLTHLQAGLRYRWELGRVTPFGAFGAGATWLDSEPLFAGSVDTVRPSASLAAGAKVRLSERLGLRLEGRSYWVDLPREFAPHMTRLSDEHLDQTELTAGLSVAF